MPKRFTESEKFRDSWYRKLTPVHKCLWEYMLAECSLAGVLEVDFEAMSFHIGSTITEKDFEPFSDRISPLEDNKIFIVSFVKFQQKELNIRQKAHEKIIKELEKYNIPLTVADCGLRYTIDTPLEGYPRCTGIGIGNSSSKGIGNSNEKKSKKNENKVSLDDLSIDHIRDWLMQKRVSGKYLTVDEDRALEMFKDYCLSKGKTYKDYVSAFRNSFEWSNTPKIRSNSNERTQSTAQGLVEWMESGREEENHNYGSSLD